MNSDFFGQPASWGTLRLKHPPFINTESPASLRFTKLWQQKLQGIALPIYDGQEPKQAKLIEYYPNYKTEI